MEPLLNKIKRLSKNIPKDDIKYADRFINNREFDKLLEIIESDIYLVQKNETLETANNRFLDIDLDKLMELKLAVEEYLSFLNISEDECTY